MTALPRNRTSQREIPRREIPRRDIPREDYPRRDYPREDYPRGDYPRGPKREIPRRDYPRDDYPRGDYPRGKTPGKTPASTSADNRGKPSGNRPDDGPSRPRRRAAKLTALVAVISLGVTGYACVLAVQKQRARAAGSASVVSGISSLAGSTGFGALSGHQANASTGNHGVTPPVTQPVLTALDRQDCPAAATACVNLTEKITWLQADGKVSYGPVRMEPGMPGTVHATPTGTFNVAWKAGPTYVSTIYHELIPWAVFFAPGGIAFHEGSLTTSSHGCVHLTMADAYYYNQHLAVGAEVVVFSGAS